MTPSAEPAIDPPGARPAALWFRMLLVAWTLVALVRVVPYLATSGGDFENLHRGAAALARGESAFARAELDYPPLVPVLLAPLGLLSLDTARVVWLALSLAALLAALEAIWRLAGRDLAASAAVAVVLAFDGTAIPNLALGQVNPLLLVLIAVALLAHRARPAGAGALVGLAAALKIWPGLLLLSWLPAAPAARRLAGRSALLAGALLVALPLGLLVLATPPPHLPVAHGYWLGTPAVLNFSAPAAVLRASYGWRPGEELPRDWVDGVNSNWRLAPERQRLSVAVALGLLAAGLTALFLRVRRNGRAPSGPGLAGALVALALVAAPIAWYHYQLLQLPAFVLALAGALRRGRWATVCALGATLLVLTRHELVAAALRAVAPLPENALYLTGVVLPLVGAAWFLVQLAALGPGPQPAPADAD
jgi:hypothetical protein